MNTPLLDVIVVGGSYAGLSAALQLGRARRHVLVVDAGLRRNRYAEHSHGFLGRDGAPAAAIAAEGRRELGAYPTVRWHEGSAIDARAEGEGFEVTLDDGQVRRARRLVLATGVTDELPAVEGLAERWGKSVFHCPYCHGYELDEGEIGVLARDALSYHQAMLLPDWGRVSLFTNGAWEPDAAQRADLQARGVRIEPTPVLRIEDRATVALADGRRIRLDGLFTFGSVRMSSPLAERLGCAFTDTPLGGVLRVDEAKQTSVPGVYAAGDAIRGMGNVALAVADGAMAGVGAHRSLVFAGASAPH